MDYHWKHLFHNGHLNLLTLDFFGFGGGVVVADFDNLYFVLSVVLIVVVIQLQNGYKRINKVMVTRDKKAISWGSEAVRRNRFSSEGGWVGHKFVISRHNNTEKIWRECLSHIIGTLGKSFHFLNPDHSDKIQINFSPW